MEDTSTGVVVLTQNLVDEMAAWFGRRELTGNVRRAGRLRF